jgi:hypothetical protein
VSSRIAGASINEKMNYISHLTTTSKVFIALSGAGLVYLVYEYVKSSQEHDEFQRAMIRLGSGNTDTQRAAAEAILEYISKDKSLRKKLCGDDTALSHIRNMLFSENEDAQFAAVEIIAVLSQDERNLDAIRSAGLFQNLVLIFTSPQASDTLVESIMIGIKNCTKLPQTIANRARVRDDDVYERVETWFAKELYQLHGLEPVVNKILADDEDIQSLALDIIINYCQLGKNKEEIGGLGGVGFIAEIVRSPTASPSLQSLALKALRHCCHHCDCNVEQLKKTGGLKPMIMYLHSLVSSFGSSPPSDDAQLEDLHNAIFVLDLIIEPHGASEIRQLGLIPKLASYQNLDHPHLPALAKHLMAQLIRMDPECRNALVTENENVGNPGFPGISKLK